MSDLPVLHCAAGEYFSLPLEFTQDDGTALDITGVTIYVTAKADLDDADVAAVIDEKVTTHSDDSAGLSAVEIDLRGVTPDRLTADVWIKDSQGHIRSYGRFILDVAQSVTISTAD